MLDGRAIIRYAGLDVELSVVQSEEPQHSNEITDNPVETGADVSDHVRSKPSVYDIAGKVVGDNASQTLSFLRSMKNSGARLIYIGRNYLADVVMQQLATTHDVETRNGFAFEMTLKQVRIAVKTAAVYVGPDPVQPSKPTLPQAKPVQNKGKQQLKTKPSTATQ